MADSVNVPNVEANSFFVVLDTKSGGYSGPGDLPDQYTWKVIDEKDVASYFSIDAANSKVSRKVVLATEVTVDQIESILKEKKKKELLAKQAQLRQEMIDAGMIPPDEPMPRPPFQPVTRAPEVTTPPNSPVQEVSIPTPVGPPKEEKPTMQKTKIGDQEVLVTEAGSIIAAPPQPRMPINPQTNKPYSDLEFEAVYSDFRERAEQNEKVICVEKGPGVFVIRTNEQMNVGKFYAGVPLIVQPMRYR